MANNIMNASSETRLERDSQYSRSSLSIIIFVLRWIGCWPPEDTRYKKFYWIYSVVIVSLCGHMFVLTQILSIFSMNDINVLVDNSYLLIQQTTMLFKLAIFIRNREKIRLLIKRLDCAEFTSQTHSQDKYIRDAMNIVRRNCHIFLCGVIVSCIIMGLQPILLGERRLPQVGWFPFDATRSPTYELLYVWQAFGVPIAGCLNASVDLLMSSLMELACAQLNVLADSIENIYQISAYNLQQNKINVSLDTFSNQIEMEDVLPTKQQDLQNEIYNEIKRCIEHHSTIMLFLKEIEKTYRWISFLQVNASCLVICITTLGLAIIPFTDSRIWGFFSYQIVMLIEILLYCWYGNEVRYMSVKVANAVYMANWVDCDSKSRQALGLLMARAQRPIIMRAGNYVELTLDTFVGVLRLSYSFFAVLQQTASE